jgi:hypothetical protein
MEYLPLMLLAFGLLVGGIAYYFIILTRDFKKPITARALELLHKGASPVEAFGQLVAERNDEQMSREVVLKILEQATLGEAASLLHSGASQREAVRKLIARGMDHETATAQVGEAALRIWCHRWRYLAAPGSIVLLLVGGVVILLGLALVQGNRSGEMVTFPYAGGITTLLGAILAASGIAMMSSLFKGSV